jgi:hypothetical protein
MGWQPNGSFVYNSKGEGIATDLEPITSIFDQKMIGYTRGFCVKGSLEKWNEILTLYSKDNLFLPHIFSILCAMGAPLLTFTAAKGILLSLQGESGSGKTLAHKAALSVWGNPEAAGVLGTKDTPKAILGRLGAIKNLPVRLDEATTFDPKHLSGLVYELVNGRGRSRATLDGSLSSTAAEWQTVSLVTTNRPLLENNIVVISEAERNRILELEVQMPKNISQIGKRIGKIFEENYGLLAQPLSFAFVRHKVKILELIEFYQNKFQTIVADDKRFWVSCGAIAFTAGTLAKALKLIDIDLKLLISWFMEVLKEQTMLNESMLEESRGFKERDEFLTALLDSLTGHILKLDSNYDITESPTKEVRARLVKPRTGHPLLYVGAPILKAFVQQHYQNSFLAVKKKLKIEDSITKRFKGTVMRCYEFQFPGGEE